VIWGLSYAEEICRYLLPFEHNTRTWQTDRSRNGNNRRHRLIKESFILCLCALELFSSWSFCIAFIMRTSINRFTYLLPSLQPVGTRMLWEAEERISLWPVTDGTLQYAPGAIQSSYAADYWCEVEYNAEQYKIVFILTAIESVKFYMWFRIEFDLRL